MKTLKSIRIIVFVPEDELEPFIKALAPAIPSFLGNYDHVCWHSEKGTEQSRKMPDGTIKKTPCRKVEFSCPDDREIIQQIINDTIIPNHPWEEPVITLTRQEIVKHSDS
tara:strand:+ start:239 stop:568 length:330 start_codon:yes stop_codon:yes gene_type:complete